MMNTNGGDHQISEKKKKKSCVIGDNGQQQQQQQLWIKLKLPKEEQQQQDQDHFVEDDDNNKAKAADAVRICHICNKGFGSGKALGGHMRIHFQTHKGPIKKKRKLPEQDHQDQDVTIADIARKINNSSCKKTTTSTTNNGFLEQNPKCSLCCRSFHSMKSLFGHMRCHPERLWRGIQPPSPSPSPESERERPEKSSRSSSTSFSSSLVSEDVVEPPHHHNQLEDSDYHENLHDDDNKAAEAAAAPVDLTKSLRGWLATAKRGSTSSKKISNTILGISSEEEEEEFLDAAHELIRLANGGGRGGVSIEATNSNSLPYNNKTEKSEDRKKTSVEEFSADDRVKGVRLVAQEIGEEYEEEDDISLDDCSDSKNTTTDQLNNPKRNGKVIMLKNKKKRKKIKDLESVQDHHVQAAAAVTESPDKYRCITCDKSFTTHQALGGHRSRHHKTRLVSIHNSVEDQYWTSATDEDDEEIIKENDQRRGISSSKHTYGGGSGKILDFDLNEVPPVEDDHGGLGTSSFNSVEFPVFESSNPRL
ncbi:hypothetical protein M9H77_14982 [Catharanthus roseus]|uniref:Uncharacterized protein n=1 Tax=Catharanthus roseus TaxID=4058 RepID=A0ACC0BPQ0_CATRO|nr:hypothetical protein M9H77_14982 [Catharanthus roseus]